MARTRQIAKLISLLPFAFVLFATRPAHATSGVTVTVWNNQTWNNQFNSSPPLPPTTPLAGQLTDTDASHNFDQQPLFNLFDDFVVLFEGYVTAPITGTITFMALADDGTKMYFNGANIINDWYDKGGGGSESTPVTVNEGVQYPFQLWFYENGGGAWVELWWQINNEWQQVPASAFTTSVQTTVAPTTLPETTTTTSTTTTTVPISTTTELPQTTTTVQQSTTTTSSSSTTTLVPETTTTTVALTVPPVPASSTSTVQQTVPPTTVPAIPTTTVDVIADVTTTTQPEQTTTTTQPVQEPTWATLPDTPDFQSATLVRGGAIGKGLKPTRLISNGLREGVTPAQQRMAVTAAVMIAIPSPITVSRRKT